MTELEMQSISITPCWMTRLGMQSQAQLTRQLHHRQLVLWRAPACARCCARASSPPASTSCFNSAIRAVMPAFAKAHQRRLADAAFRTPIPPGRLGRRAGAGRSRLSRPQPNSPDGLVFVTEPTLCDWRASWAMGSTSPNTTPRPRPPRPITMCFPRFSWLCRSWAHSSAATKLRPLPGTPPCAARPARRLPASGADARAARRIAILDWREVPTYSEFMLFQDYFASQDFECVIADPRQLEYRDGQLLVDGITPVHLIYKRVLHQRAGDARRSG